MYNLGFSEENFEIDDKNFADAGEDDLVDNSTNAYEKN